MVSERRFEMDLETIERNYSDNTLEGTRRGWANVVRAEALSLALTINGLCPPGREGSLAMTKLEECVMWAVAAIERSEEGDAA